ncbi:MAG: porin [Myxococcota bacterium]
MFEKKAAWHGVPMMFLAGALTLAPRVSRAEEAAAAPAAKTAVEKAVESAKISGFAVPWLRLGEAPADNKDARAAFRLRYARVNIDSNLAKDIAAKVVVSLEDPKNPLFDMQLAWKKYDAANIIVGQFRPAFGELVPSPSADLVMMDRPDYMSKMDKKRLRDMGIVLGTGKAGLYNGLVNYWVGVMNGNGVANVGSNDIDKEGSYRDLLYVGRVMLNPGKAFAGKKFDVRIGASAMRTTSPALEGKDEAAVQDLAKDFLGTTYTFKATQVNPTKWTAPRRQTQLTGAEFMFKAYGLYLQSEYWMLHSEPRHGATDANKKDAVAWHADIAYTIAPVNTQIAYRLESFDPNPDAEDDEIVSSSIGVNYFVNDNIALSLFGTSTDDHAGTDGVDKPNNHFDARMVVKF